MICVVVEHLRFLATLALQKSGVPQADAASQADLLIEAELRGVPSHGLLRLPRVIRRIENGVADPKSRGMHIWRRDAFLEVDGQCGLGPIVANAALDLLMERVVKTGVAVAAIRNSNHIGMLGWYAECVAARGYTIIALSTSEALVHPWGGRKAMLGTNPIAIGVPTGGHPFVMDAATSLVSMGEIHDHALRGVPIPPDWALDAAGNPTTDAAAAKTGSIAPFGKAKGYALGLGFELLVSSLAAAAIGREVTGTLDDTSVCNKGDLFIVVDGPVRDLQQYLQEIRMAAPAEGFAEVLVPGERGRLLREERLRNGVLLAEDLWEQIRELAATDDVPQN
ncbi:Ldh family oxidoreductase [Pararhizobium sp. YC-54]|uniref:Ldh family oxidoreductase n=1 Tax=Pararhizobium sp. YC-54 TaxID=2986920 RepID=UPI0021F74304|nr:Ldh family oxidoreductase [Pararhizobium sp. YC-54]MCV9999329.1 Ldh family oxidoreductase [Pararhizobium sp. YC-54]